MQRQQQLQLQQKQQQHRELLHVSILPGPDDTIPDPVYSGDAHFRLIERGEKSLAARGERVICGCPSPRGQRCRGRVSKNEKSATYTH